MHWSTQKYVMSRSFRPQNQSKAKATCESRIYDQSIETNFQYYILPVVGHVASLG